MPAAAIGPFALAAAGAVEALFADPPRLVVQSAAERHDTKKRSGSSDGAQTYDTPVT